MYTGAFKLIHYLIWLHILYNSMFDFISNDKISKSLFFKNMQ